jgi:hypothetical protein
MRRRRSLSTSVDLLWSVAGGAAAGILFCAVAWLADAGGIATLVRGDADGVLVATLVPSVIALFGTSALATSAPEDDAKTPLVRPAPAPPISPHAARRAARRH